MELSMSMRFLRIRARQKANNGPVYSEHTLSALLLLAASDPQTVMPSGTDTVKNAIAAEIADLREALGELYGIGDPKAVMERYDEIIAANELETAADREFAALQADAQRWMEDNSSYGEMIVPIAMLHAVHQRPDFLIDEAMLTVGDASSGGYTPKETRQNEPAADPMATQIDNSFVDPMATVVDNVYIEEASSEADLADEAAEREREEAEQREREEKERREREEAEQRERDEEERRRREREEVERREYEDEERRKREREAAERREREDAEKAEALKQAILQQAVNEALAEAQRNRGKQISSGAISGRAFGHFIGFAVVVFVAWQVYLRLDDIAGIEPTWWTKCLLFVVYLIAFIVSIRNINGLRKKSENAASRTSMMRIQVTGTAGMIYFRLVIISTIIPAILLLITNLVYDEITPFWYHFFSIYIFCWLWGLITFAFQSNMAALSVGRLDYRQLKRKKGAVVGSTIFGALTIPALVMFLHWHFDWFPMKVWVIVLIIIYLVICLISIIAVSRQSPYDLQNEGY